MLLKNKYVQVGLVSTAVIIGSLLAAGCSAGSETTVVPSVNQPAVSAPTQPQGGSANQPTGVTTGIPANRPTAIPSNIPATPAGTPVQKPAANPSQPAQLSNSFAKVAAILGIDQQKLEDAFNQARIATGDQVPSGANMPARPSGTAMPVPTGTNMPLPPGGSGMPAPSGVPGQPRIDMVPSSDLMSKVASILGIDQQKLTDAFNQVMQQP